MKRFKLPHVIVPILAILIFAVQVHADLATCLYFYKPLPGLKSFTPTSTEASTNLNAVLKHILANHFNVKEITPQMTVEAFANFVDIVDPTRTLISKEDLKKLGYPNADLFGGIQYNLVQHGRPSEQHIFLLRLMNERMDSYIRKFLHIDSFRNQVVNRAKQLLAEKTEISLERPSLKADIENRVIDFIAVHLIEAARIKYGTEKPELQKNDLAFAIKVMRASIDDAKENLPNSSVEQLVIKSYLKTFDHHTDLFLARDQRNRDDAVKARPRLGTTSSLNADGIHIEKVVKGSPAEAAGILKGDTILAYETEFNSGIWQSLRNKTMTEYGQIASGDPGTQIRVRIRRGTDEFETVLTRKMMSYTSFVVGTQGIKETPQGNIVNIKLSEFAKDSSKSLKDEISKHLSKNLKGIILDLRGNGGGLVTELSDILQLFVSKPTAMYAKTRKDLIPFHPFLFGLSLWDGPLVVLVDQGSASASEALSAALKSYKRAIIVGGPNTYGKGSMQDYGSINNLNYKYTSALFYSPSGLPIQWRGVDADIPLPVAQKYHRESDHAKSLNPKPLSGGIGHTWALNPDLGTITQTLKAKSAARSEQQELGKTPEEIYKQNTEEAYRILADWVEIDSSGNGGW